jgi:peroxiredoxin
MARRCAFGLIPFLLIVAGACSRQVGSSAVKATPTAHVGVHMAGAPHFGKQVFKDTAGNILSEERFGELMMDNKHTIEHGRTVGDVHEIIVREMTAEETRREKAAEETRRGIAQGLQWAKAMTPSKAPDVSFTDITGTTVAAAALRGKVVVLNFWFPACKPCVAEVPELNRLVDRYAARGVVFIAPSRDDKTALVQFLATHRFAYRVCPSATELIARFQVIGYPTNVVIDRIGMMILSETGLGPATVALVERAIAKALGDAPPTPAPPA